MSRGIRESEPLYEAVEKTVGQPLRGHDWRIPPALKLEITDDLSIPGRFQKDRKQALKQTPEPRLRAELFTNAKRKSPSPSTAEWINQVWSSFTMEYYSAVKEVLIHEAVT